ncbi:MAG: 2-dehydropantoate 2-reductase [Rhizobiales bacterium 62-47]|nr:2-dehydropantoate 2-reductase [Hyphomicrobiales bacterium]OJY13036.1 MAG: 2-dehydropantoate 2-reductase [Rhizobiales bacterium 62-47]
MRILVVGAGAIGGYFGGRLLQSGADITFLVRPRRAEELARDGLVIKSPHGDATLPKPPTVLAQDLKQPFDIILLSCKAFDLDDAIASFAPAMGPQSAIMPMLNGMRHLDVLDRHFGRERVLGGQCAIAATLDANRHVVQLTPMQSLGFGERDGSMSARVNAANEIFARGNFDGKASATIVLDMWEKWVLLATLACSTCLMRAAIGKILLAPGGRDYILGVRDEIIGIATAAGYAPRMPFIERITGILTAEGSPFTASMFRDIVAGLPIEADHIVGDLIARAAAAKLEVSRLRIAYTHLKTYEAQRG